MLHVKCYMLHVKCECSIQKVHRTQDKMIKRSIRQEIEEQERVEQVEEPEATSILMLFRYNLSCVDIVISQLMIF